MIARLRSMLYILQLGEYDLPSFRKFLSTHKQRTGLERRAKLKWTAHIKLLLAAAVVLLLTLPALGIALKSWFIVLAGILLASWLVLGPVEWLLLTAESLLRPIKLVVEALITKLRSMNLQRSQYTVIGITGSYGKTSFKEILAALLEENYPTEKTLGNLNTPLGIIRSFKHLNPKTKYVIAELGASRVGDIRRLVAITRPSIGVLTGINEAHIEKFGSLANTIAEKFALIDSLPSDGLALLNHDDPNVAGNADKFKLPMKTLWYGYPDAAKYRIANFKQRLDRINFDFYENENFLFATEVRLLGEHNLRNIMGAIMLARVLDVSYPAIQAGLKKIRPIPHRLEPVMQPSGGLLIDDSYNGNPEGARAAMATLKSYKPKQLIYVTPGFVESGSELADIHRELGRELAESSFDRTILIETPATEHILRGLTDNGYPNEKITRYPDMPTFIQNLPELMTNDTVVLIQNDWPDNYV